MEICTRQRTLKNVIRATGSGHHPDGRVHLTLRPAPPDHGIVFLRTDLDRPVRLPARADWVAVAAMAATLTDGAATLSMFEHLLAAFAGLGIDNALVEVDAHELPVMDGSAGPFVFLLQSAGIAVQDAPKCFIRVRKRIIHRDGAAWAELAPHDGFRLEYARDDDHPVIRPHQQAIAVELSPTVFVREIARARTPGAPSGSNRLQGPNSAPDANTGNPPAKVDCRIPSDAGRRLGDEFARHKILDAIGDLYLLGYRLVGAFTGYRSGHATNLGLLRRLLADPEAWEVVSFADRAELPGATGRPTVEFA